MGKDLKWALIILAICVSIVVLGYVMVYASGTSYAETGHISRSTNTIPLSQMKVSDLNVVPNNSVCSSSPSQCGKISKVNPNQIVTIEKQCTRLNQTVTEVLKYNGANSFIGHEALVQHANTNAIVNPCPT